MSNFLSDFISVFRSKVATIIFGLGKAIIIARFLGPELNGLITSLLVYPTLFMTFGALGVRKSSAFLLGSQKFNEEEIKISVMQAWVLSTLFSVISIFVLIYFLTKAEYDFLTIGLAISAVPFALLNTYLSGIYLGNNKIKEFNEVSWVPPLVTFAVCLLLIVVFDFSIYGALIAELAGPLFMSLILVMRMDISRYLRTKFNPELLKALFKLGGAYAISLLVINLNYRIDVVIMDWLSNPFEIGIYSKGAVLSQYLWQIPMMLGTIVFARGTRAKDRALFSKKVCQVLRVSLTFIGAGCLFLLMFAKYIILVLFGSDFLPSVSVMIWLLPGVLLLTIFKVLNMDMGGQGKPWFALKSMIPALIVNVILNLLVVPSYGAVGAAFSSTVSYSFGAILFLVQYSKATQIPLREIFKFSKEDFSFATPYVNKLRHLVRL